MKSKKKSTLTTDIIGIFCGVLLVAVGVISAISANAGRTAGMKDSQIPDTAMTLVGTAEGRNGDISVQVKADADKIYQVKILSEDETRGIGSKAIQNIPKAIYNSNSLQVDGTSGATITSDAIKNAVYNAMREGGLDAYKFGLIKTSAVSKRVEVDKKVSAMSAEEWQEQFADWDADHEYLYASYWEDEYPEIYASYMANADNADHPSYLDAFPQLKSIYAGYPFSYDYDEARGHNFVIEDVTETDRLHKKLEDGSLNPEIFQKGNCFTCKSPIMTAIANETEGRAYAWNFATMMNMVTEPVSCYTCHGQTPGEFTVTHTYLADGVGEHLNYIDGATLSCGQCHNEYYFAPDTKATTLPHTSIDTMHPDAILKYYNELKGDDGQPFTDFTNKISGVKVIKVQHPELETYLSEGSVHRGTFTCADCHMGDMTKADGTTTKNHFISSPLDNPALIESTCSKCHANLQADVEAIQKKTLERTRALADKLVELHNAIGAAAESGKYSDDELQQIRSVARDAQFYWDFVFVENSEGAHNSALTAYCQDQAEKLMDQAFDMLK